MSVDFRQSAEFLRGRNGEQVVARFLQEKGYFVIPSYDYSGEDDNKAPKMQGKGIAYVIPDLDVCKAGTRKWVEVKTKTEPTFHRVSRQLQHGIDERHFVSYQQVQQESGCQVSLAIHELTGPEGRPVLLIATLDHLAKNIHHKATWAGSKMLYWDRNVFTRYEVPPEADDEQPGASP